MFSAAGAASSPWVAGEVFPLPRLAAEPPPRGDLSRGTVQRVQRRRRLIASSNSTIDALNWMAGAQPTAPATEPTTVQRQMQADVVNSHSLFSAATVLHPREAASALLRGHSVYDTENSTLRPFKKCQVALPDGVVGAPYLRDLLREPERVMLERLTTNYMKSDDELVELAPVTPYVDPILRHRRSVYLDFLEELRARDLICWRRRVRSQAGMFFVAKKSPEEIRMIIDARPANRITRDPPGVALTTVENCTMVHLAPSDRLFISKGDVSACFYRLKIDGPLVELFGLPAVSAREAGLTELDGLPLLEDSMIYPCLQVLPMGFSWSLFLPKKLCRARSSELWVRRVIP